MSRKLDRRRSSEIGYWRKLGVVGVPVSKGQVRTAVLFSSI